MDEIYKRGYRIGLMGALIRLVRIGAFTIQDAAEQAEIMPSDFERLMNSETGELLFRFDQLLDIAERTQEECIELDAVESILMQIEF